MNQHKMGLAFQTLNTFLIFMFIFFISSTSYAFKNSSLIRSQANYNEAMSLLKWKHSLDDQSQSFLSTWTSPNPSSSPSSHCNSWSGISCDAVGRVAHVNISGYGVRGNLLNLDISLFSHLTSLNLSTNLLFGNVPTDIGLLRSLVELDLSRNNLTGPIPGSIGFLAKLEVLYLSKNQLVGIIPQETGLLKSLTELDLSGNNFTSSIPNSIGNLTKLLVLHLFDNKLSNNIPGEIGFLSSLTDLQLHRNNLTGQIPSSLGNLANLSSLYLCSNRLTGTIPQSINNLTKLVNFQALNNKLTGYLPQNICRGGFLARFGVGNNSFIGPVPKSLKNCTTLIRLRLDMNQLSGDVSKDFGVYPYLDYIDLSYNNLYGELSSNWGLCRNLTSLRISNNNITGKIPQEIGELTKLKQLELSSNNLDGVIPKGLGKLLSLFDLDLSKNNFSGTVPVEIGALLELQNLNLGANKLTGPIPDQIYVNNKLLNLNLSQNILQGEISTKIENLLFLETLDLSHNNLFGDIPQTIGKLNTLEKINISHNRLSGYVPNTMKNIVSLMSIDISYNALEGPLPDTIVFQEASIKDFTGNKNLCGNITGLSKCPSRVIGNNCGEKGKHFWVLATVSTVGVSMFLLFFLGALVVVKKRTNTKVQELNIDNNENLFAVRNYNGKIVYEDIIEATENFSSEHCVGEGGHGAVYKAELSSGQVVAVKKLHFSQDLQLDSKKSFTSEIYSLTKIRHRNIIKLHGFCMHRQNSFLVYEFLEGGSLAKILRSDDEAKEFEWTKRMDIIKGVANGLTYMHHECSPPIVHRDISSKNILLDLDYVSHISDFGTARVLSNTTSNCTSFAGTFGYAAPELAYTVEVKENQDVYSFGILILEVLMGRHPGDLISSLSMSGMSPSTSSFLDITLLEDVLDHRVPTPQNITILEEIIHATRLAISCLKLMPDHRPSMQQVSTELLKQKPALIISFPMLTLGQLIRCYK